MKIRINDLARELEVKSKAILDVLPLVGVTEKKTHSSSIEADEAERVRAHFQAQSETQTGGSARTSRARGEEPDAIKTKIDLSHISKPGDVLKLITQKQQAAAAPPVKRPVAPAPAVPPAEIKPAAAPPAAVQPPAKPAAPP
ncbi:MAG TPA: translation initiation factor IF-2 N-terminal domain-containing protein, partial [Terriglobales bacterium]|nr:translation initiation factor IF-2 N-terminal domain-containing protein [Terriglobales bacterium]